MTRATLRILNKRQANIPAGAVYIGRPSVWGNPIWFDAERRVFLIASQPNI